MLKIGRYGIAFGPILWLQTRGPTTVRHFLWFWFLKEARPHDVDKEPQFTFGPLGTLLEQKGRVYRYWKASQPHRTGDSVELHEERRHYEGISD